MKAIVRASVSCRRSLNHAKTLHMIRSRQVRLAGTAFSRPRHVCAFFNSKEEEYQVLLPFIKEGFDEGHRAFHVVDSRRPAEHLQRLTEAGIDVGDAQKKGQLEVRGWDNAYLQNGYFDQNRMLSLIESVLTEGRAQGYASTRLVANMEWGLENRPGVGDIVEYETRLNYILPKYMDDTVCCTYDVARFGASVVMDILRTHPLVIIGGTLQENPFAVPPDEFLEELRERASLRAS